MKSLRWDYLSPLLKSPEIWIRRAGFRAVGAELMSFVITSHLSSEGIFREEKAKYRKKHPTPDLV